jgi:hypothetical protein
VCGAATVQKQSMYCMYVRLKPFLHPNRLSSYHRQILIPHSRAVCTTIVSHVLYCIVLHHQTFAPQAPFCFFPYKYYYCFTRKFLETLATRLTEKQNSLCNASYGETINWLRLRLQAWCFVPQRQTIHALSLSRKGALYASLAIQRLLRSLIHSI